MGAPAARSVVLHLARFRTLLSVAPSPHDRFAALVVPHLPELRAFAERRAPSLADDVLSEVGVVAWRRLDEIPRGRERAWLYGVTRNVLLAEHRKAVRHDVGRSEVEPADLAAPASADAPLAPGVHGPLAVALAELPARDRELLLLTAWEGLSTAEAAAALGIRATAARMALVRARRRLAAALDRVDPGWAVAGRTASVEAAPASTSSTSPSTSSASPETATSTTTTATEGKPCATAER